jgi:hypothetical protein
VGLRSAQQAALQAMSSKENRLMSARLHGLRQVAHWEEQPVAQSWAPLRAKGLPQLLAV